jgi:glyoxylase-like metal-dependent hydrolase (beta-lactamase superfamily II)
LQNLGVGALGAVLGGTLTERVLGHWYGSQAASPILPLHGRGVEPATLTLDGGIKIHAIQTGYVAVKTVHREYTGNDGGGLLAIVADSTWTEWLPINTWAIEHPEGVILVDTGESSRATSDSANYFACDPGTAFFYNSFLRLAVAPEDEMAAQLRGLNIAPADVRWIVQTHLHGDHMGGLKDFPNAQVFVPTSDYPASQGTLYCRYPEAFAPTLVNFVPEPLQTFSQTLPVTADGALRIIPTPGHTAGHQSVMLTLDDMSYCFAGDTSFDDTQLLSGAMAGIVADPAQSRATLAALRDYCQSTPTVYLPTHDHASRERLLQQRATEVTA